MAAVVVLAVLAALQRTLKVLQLLLVVSLNNKGKGSSSLSHNNKDGDDHGPAASVPTRCIPPCAVERRKGRRVAGHDGCRHIRCGGMLTRA